MKPDADTSVVVSLPARSRVHFLNREDGALTGHGLLLLLSMMVISAAAVDVSRLMAARSHLQVAADTAAHAALYLREQLPTAQQAIDGAIDLVTADLPPAKYGVVIDSTDIVFGHWDDSTRSFTPDMTSRDAAKVTARLSDARSNPVKSLFFNLVGVDDFDVATTAVFETYRPTCLTEGFVAEDVVDVQSNNLYGGGFCVHSNTYVSLNSNSTFEPGSIVSMPDPNDLDAPSSASKTNEGLDEALRSGAYRLRILEKLDRIMLGLETGDRDVLPGYISGTVPIKLSPKGGNAVTADFEPGRVHEYTCHNSNGTLSITTEPGVPLTEIVLVTNCKIKFGEGTLIEDAVIATWSTSDRSITAPSGLQAGRNDACAAGGSVQILTQGGMEFASKLALYGSQLMAKGDITFSANADGIEGASIISGGTISGTSNMAMGYCGTAMDNNYAADYFRLRL